MSKEILQVEFEVESTVDRKWGFQEKSLRFRGGDTRYKGIVKEGELVAILGKNYRLIPNEDVEVALNAIAHEHGLSREYYASEWKIYDCVWDVKRMHGVLVVNSVDGTVSLKCIAIINLGGKTGIFVSSRIQNIIRKHTRKSVSMVEDLEGEVGQIMEESKKYGDWLAKMDTVKAKPNMEILQSLFDKLPKEYTKGLQNMVQYKTFVEPTLKNVYESIAKKIWSAETKMVTKLVYYRHLNDIMFVIVGL